MSARTAAVTSTASDHCRTPGHDKTARTPNSERLLANARKTPLQGGSHAGRKRPGAGRETGARGSRAAHQLGNRCGRAIGRAILQNLGQLCDHRPRISHQLGIRHLDERHTLAFLQHLADLPVVMLLHLDEVRLLTLGLRALPGWMIRPPGWSRGRRVGGLRPSLRHTTQTLVSQLSHEHWYRNWGVVNRAGGCGAAQPPPGNRESSVGGAVPRGDSAAPATGRAASSPVTGPSSGARSATPISLARLRASAA